MPVNAEQSATKNDDEELYGARNAIDMVLGTESGTVADSNGKSWLKFTLDKVNCIERVAWIGNTGDPYLTWTCTETDCSNCVGDYCSYFTLTVSTEGAVSDLSPVSDCKHGDTVKFEKVTRGGFGLYEIAIVGKPGIAYI